MGKLAEVTTSDGEEKRLEAMKFREEEAKLKMEVESKQRETEEGEIEEDEEFQDPVPVGEVVKVSRKGKAERKHYRAFEFDGNRYEIDDTVLIAPEEQLQKPLAAIIKDITRTEDGTMLVTGQCFYRPEDAVKKGGGSWKLRDGRELFYSFRREEVLAHSVLHSCTVHFLPSHKQWPDSKQHPGFIVENVYDTVEQKLWSLSDTDYGDSKKGEVDSLVKQTLSRLEGLPDL